MLIKFKLRYVIQFGELSHTQKVFCQVSIPCHNKDVLQNSIGIVEKHYQDHSESFNLCIQKGYELRFLVDSILEGEDFEKKDDPRTFLTFDAAIQFIGSIIGSKIRERNDDSDSDNDEPRDRKRRRFNRMVS